MALKNPIYFNHILIHEPETVTIQVKDDHGNSVLKTVPGPVKHAATVAMKVAGNRIIYGVSFCSEADNFSRKKGRKIAQHRLESDQMSIFTSDCHLTQFVDRIMPETEPDPADYEDTKVWQQAMNAFRDAMYSQFTAVFVHASQLYNAPHWFRAHLSK